MWHNTEDLKFDVGLGIGLDNKKTSWAVDVMEAIEASETAPIYVKVLLLEFEICANIYKVFVMIMIRLLELGLLI